VIYTDVILIVHLLAVINTMHKVCVCVCAHARACMCIYIYTYRKGENMYVLFVQPSLRLV